MNREIEINAAQGWGVKAVFGKLDSVLFKLLSHSKYDRKVALDI